MRIKDWMQNRETPGTLADVARRVLEKDAKYREVERTLQSMYVLEALMKHGGHQQKAAKAIGITRHTMRLKMRAIGITGAEVRAIVKRMQGRPDGDGSTATAA